MNFKITEEFLDLMNQQVTQTKVDLDFYNKMSESEYNAFRNYIDSPTSVLELGCGLGRMSIYLNSKLKNNPHFILADVTAQSDKVRYGWNPGESYYNDLDLTAKFCKMNGLPSFSTFDLNSRKITELENIDLVMSFLSVGFHYPIEGYLEDLIKITSKDAVMIFGVRSGIYSSKDFEDKFSQVDFINNQIEETKEQILILRK